MSGIGPVDFSDWTISSVDIESRKAILTRGNDEIIVGMVADGLGHLAVLSGDAVSIQFDDRVYYLKTGDPDCKVVKAAGAHFGGPDVDSVNTGEERGSVLDKAKDVALCSLPKTLPSASEPVSASTPQTGSCGRKHAYLQELNSAFKGHVPDFLGVSSELVMEAMPAEKREEIESLWSELNNGFEEGNSQAFFKREETEAKLDRVRELVAEGIDSDEFSMKLFTPELDGLLEKMTASGQTLMVRSSGDEDASSESGEGVVAGKHLSLGGVKPDRNAFLQAYKQVALSYYATSALEFRGRFSTPFEKTPNMSAVIQHQIRESEKGENVPTAVFLMTSKPSYSDEHGPRVSELSAAYGQGEAIADNRLPVDRATISGEAIYYQNQLKQSRLVPGESGSDLVENSPEVAKTRCLDDVMVQRVVTLGQEIEAYYGKPMDVELVVQNNEIYIVQARELHTAEVTPSYLSPALLTGEEVALDPIEMQVIVSGNSAVFEGVASDVLFAKSLEEAEERFDVNNHKVVVVHEAASAESHSAINFRSYDPPITCIRLDKKSWDNASKAKGDSPLVISPQQEICIFGELPSGAVEEGWFTHPANTFLSTDSNLHASSTIGSQVTPARTELNAFKMAPTRENFEALRGKVISHIQELDEKLSIDGLYQADEIRLTASKVATHARVILDRIESALDRSSDGRMEVLLHVKMLERTMGQRTREGESTLGKASIASIESEIKAQEVASEYMRRQGADCKYAKQAGYAVCACNEELKEEWFRKLEELESQSSPGFIESIDAIQEMGLFPNWLALASNESPPQDLDSLRVAQGLTKRLKGIRFELGAVDSASGFERIASELASIREDLIEQAQHGATDDVSFQQFVQMQVVIELTESYDTLIKRVKSSGVYKDEALTQAFQTHVREFAQLYYGMSDSLFSSSLPGFDDQIVTLLQGAVEGLEEQGVETLRPSPGFDVRRLTPPLRTNDGLNFTLPRTGEDIFTTLHQNMLANARVLQFQGVAGGSAEESIEFLARALPSQLHSEIQSTIGGADKASTENIEILSVDFSDEGATVQMNIPFDVHGLRFSYEYVRATESVRMHLSLEGDMELRGRAISDLVELSAVKNGIEMIEAPTFNSAAGVLSLGLSFDDSNLDQLSSMVADIARYTTDAKGFEPRIMKELMDDYIVTSSEQEKAWISIAGILSSDGLDIDWSIVEGILRSRGSNEGLHTLFHYKLGGPAIGPELLKEAINRGDETKELVMAYLADAVISTSRAGDPNNSLILVEVLDTSVWWLIEKEVISVGELIDPLVGEIEKHPTLQNVRRLLLFIGARDFPKDRMESDTKNAIKGRIQELYNKHGEAISAELAASDEKKVHKALKKCRKRKFLD